MDSTAFEYFKLEASAFKEAASAVIIIMFAESAIADSTKFEANINSNCFEEATCWERILERRSV